jgi:hypothetical protein
MKGNKVTNNRILFILESMERFCGQELTILDTHDTYVKIECPEGNDILLWELLKYLNNLNWKRYGVKKDSVEIDLNYEKAQKVTWR